MRDAQNSLLNRNREFVGANHLALPIIHLHPHCYIFTGQDVSAICQFTSSWLVKTVLVAPSRHPFHCTFMPTLTKLSITDFEPFGVFTLMRVLAFQVNFFVPTIR